MDAKRRIGDRARRALGVLKAFSLRIPDGPEMHVDVDVVYGPADSGDLASDLAGAVERTKGKPVATWNHPSVIRRGSGPRSIRATRDADTSVALNEMPVVDLSGKTLISFTGHEVSSSICTTRQPTRRRR